MIFFKRRAAGMILLMILCLMSYLLGRSHAQIKVVEAKSDEIIKEAEVIKYVEREKAKIWHKPNAGRDALLKLMYQDRL